MLWDVSVSPAVLSKSLPHCHRDWITGCVWTPDCVVNVYFIFYKNLASICLTALFFLLQSQTPVSYGHISAALLCCRLAVQTTAGCVYGMWRQVGVLKKSPGRVLWHLSAVWWADYFLILFFKENNRLIVNSPHTLINVNVCVQGQYVIAGCAEGALHVWMWETSIEICHIAAHNQRIHHCSVLPNPGSRRRDCTQYHFKSWIFFYFTSSKKCPESDVHVSLSLSSFF